MLTGPGNSSPGCSDCGGIGADPGIAAQVISAMRLCESGIDLTGCRWNSTLKLTIPPTPLVGTAHQGGFPFCESDDDCSPIEFATASS